MIKKNLSALFLTLASITFALIICEIILRVKHNIIPNYDIEMWRYAKELKLKVEFDNINHIHFKNKSSVLQKVEIKTNSYGQRDINYDNNYLNKFDKSFLIIGSSIPLGWGVEKEKTFAHLLNIESKKKGKKWIFINGGVGNYNASRYVNNYLKYWKDLDFTHIIITYFVNDAEILLSKKTNFLVKHTHTGVVLWKLYNSFNSSLKKENLTDYYKNIYSDNSQGFRIAKKELMKINDHCILNNIKCILMNMPDIHQLNPYKLDFINKKISNFSNEINLEYLDLLTLFENIDEKKVWNKYQDPHPNAYAHAMIAKKIFDYLN